MSLTRSGPNQGAIVINRLSIGLTGNFLDNHQILDDLLIT